jgi:hypothetical protein
LLRVLAKGVDRNEQKHCAGQHANGSQTSSAASGRVSPAHRSQVLRHLSRPSHAREQPLTEPNACQQNQSAGGEGDLRIRPAAGKRQSNQRTKQGERAKPEAPTTRDLPHRPCRLVFAAQQLGRRAPGLATLGQPYRGDGGSQA